MARSRLTLKGQASQAVWLSPVAKVVPLQRWHTGLT